MLGYKTANPAIPLNALLDGIGFISNALFAVIADRMTLFRFDGIDRLPVLLIDRWIYLHLFDGIAGQAD